MNEEKIILCVEPYLNSEKELTYDEFDNIFNFLNCNEQYQVSEFLVAAGIKLVDDKSTNIPLNDNVSTKSKKTIIVTSDAKIKRPVNVSSCVKKCSKSKNIKTSLLKESNEDLVVKYQKTKSKIYMQALIKKNEKFLYKEANKFLNVYESNFEIQDGFDIACIGFIKACNQFDISKQAKLITYATFEVRQILRREIKNKGTMIRMPEHIYTFANKVLKAMKENPEADCYDLALMLNVPKQKIDKVQEYLHRCFKIDYLDRNINNEGSTNLIDTVVSTDYDFSNDMLPESNIARELLKEDIEEVLSGLSPRERDVLRLRFGMEDERQRTLEEVGQLFDVTRERIRQIEAKALRKLRHPNRSKRLYEYIDCNHQNPTSYFYTKSTDNEKIKIRQRENINKDYQFVFEPSQCNIFDRIIKLNEDKSSINFADMYKQFVECSEYNNFKPSLKEKEFIEKVKADKRFKYRKRTITIGK